MAHQSLFRELRRRHVFRVAVAYVVTAWLLLQLGAIIFPTLHAPAWCEAVLLAFLLLGLPVALLLAWAFEVTPDGVRRTESVESEAARPAGYRRHVGRALNVGIIVALAAAVGLLAWQRFGAGAKQHEARMAGAVSAPSKGTVVLPMSVAVLPFDNMSGDPKQQYFSDGMTEQLLDVLAKVPQLEVVARTSVFQFKNKGGDVRVIGRKLGVANIVEGSVRRDGQEIRVTAQLVRVSDGFHVWSETYDRKLKSVFAVQDDIAQHIANKLTRSLGVTPKVARRAPIDPAAYDEFLKGRTLLRQRKDLRRAIAHFEAAVAKAPNFAQAWSSLALAEDAIYWYEPMDRAEAKAWIEKAAVAATRAQQLAPDSAETEHVLGNVARENFDYASAEQHYLRSIAIDPSYPDVREDYSELLLQVGRARDSLAAARDLVKLDPYFIVGWDRIFSADEALDDPSGVKAALDRMRKIDPSGSFNPLGDLEYPLMYSRAGEARRAAEKLGKRFPGDARQLKNLLAWALNEPVTDPAALKPAMKTIGVWELPYFIVDHGDVATYLNFLDHAGPVGRTYLYIELGYVRPAGWKMLRDPRIKARLREYGFVTYWREKGWPAACRPLGETDFECGLGAGKDEQDEDAGSGAPLAKRGHR